ncbi:MAG: ABC transporter ATP-binding protein [Jiangellaceae bacterium]
MLTTLEREVAATAVDGIVLRDLRKTYRTRRGDIHAVRGVDIAVARGETVVLLGPNGAGKSTTIDMLLGLQKPDIGTVSVFGHPPYDAVRRGRVGAMLQTGGLLRELTVRELLTMMAGLYPNPLDLDEVLGLAGIEELASKSTDNLSGGQAQRVRFAMSLVSDPELLVFDEPTVGMDVEARQGFWTTVHRLARQGKTILFATHYLAEADAYADRAVLMARGRVVADGPTTEIKAIVGTRTIRATLPGVPVDVLELLPGVTRVERRGEVVELVCSDSDAAIRALLAEHARAQDIEIRGAALEQAFLELTSHDGADEEGDER